VDAYRLDEVVLEPDLADPATARWPAFAPRAVQAGARAVFGFPLRTGGARVGALNLYCDRPSHLSNDQHAAALVMAEVIVQWVSMRKPVRPRVLWPASWRPALTSFHRAQRKRHHVGTTGGQRDRGLDSTPRLRVQSRRLLRDVALDIVDGRLRFG
jgi:hypothetical protein